MCSPGSARSSPSGTGVVSMARCVMSSTTGSSRRRRAAKRRSLSLAASSHWTSSTATRTGSARASARNAVRKATATARGSGALPSDSTIRNAASSARRCGAGSRGSTSSKYGSSRSPTPASESFASASAGRAERTRKDIWRPMPMPASQRIVLPIPASPVRTIPAGPSTADKREEAIAATSSSLPMTPSATADISPVILGTGASAWKGPDGALEGLSPTTRWIPRGKTHPPSPLGCATA